MRLGLWLRAARLRTLALSILVVGVSSALAYRVGAFDGWIALLLGITMGLLQVLSNFANVLGDSLHGIDGADRQGPSRAVQAGSLRPTAMRRAMFWVGGVALTTGTMVVLYAFYGQWARLLGVFGLGLVGIWGAVAYAYGSKPYGHAGWGDLSVIIFFGLLGIGCCFFLYTGYIDWGIGYVGYAMGSGAAVVLHLNNWRDIATDLAAGKRSWAGRLGRRGSVWYYRFLVISVVGALCGYTALFGGSWVWLWGVLLWGIVAGMVGERTSSARLDRQLAYTIVAKVVLWAVFSAQLVYI